MLRQIEWRLQDGPITKSRVLPLTNFAKFTGKHLWQSLFFNKVTGLRPETLVKKRLWHMCFTVDLAKFLRTPLLIGHGVKVGPGPPNPGPRGPRIRDPPQKLKVGLRIPP